MLASLLALAQYCNEGQVFSWTSVFVFALIDGLIITNWLAKRVDANIKSCRMDIRKQDNPITEQ